MMGITELILGCVNCGSITKNILGMLSLHVIRNSTKQKNIYLFIAYGGKTNGYSDKYKSS